jgi:hypothetical protein
MRTPSGIAAALCLLLAGVVHADEFQAGAARADITPPLGYAMWGYGARHDKPSTGVLDPLQARALVLAVGDQRIALVSLDLGRAPTRKSTAAIQAKVKQAANIEHLFLVASHTHHGPVIEVDTWPKPDQSYVRQLELKLSDLIIEAARKLRPARLGITSREVAFNRNRHSRRADAPVDREMLVLRVEDQQGKPIAHAVNFAAHATTGDSKLLQFSADYPGVLAKLIEKETNAPCLFLQGAAGNLTTNQGEHRGTEKYGQAVGREVLAMIGAIKCEEIAKPSLQVREETFTFPSRIDLRNPLVKRAMVAAFFRDLVDFYEREYREGVRPRLTVALLNEQIGFVGVSGEFFCGHSVQLKRRARLPHLLFLGYCNDYQQYFPTIEAASEGGYGTEPPVAPAELGAGEKIMDRALLHLYQMRGKLKR